MDKPSTSKEPPAPLPSPTSPDAPKVRVSDSDVKEDAELLDSQLEDCAKKYNLSCLNVKNIIFHIIKDPRTFSSLLTGDPEAAENLRITRSRLKELEAKSKTKLNIELKPMNPVRTFADVDFGDDDADPDYQPDADDIEIDDDFLDDWFDETEDEQFFHDMAQTSSSVGNLDEQQFLSTVDPDYADFLKRCATPHQTEYDEEDEDDDEYNYNEVVEREREEPDEYRMDRSTKITFRELNALIEDAVPEDARVEIFQQLKKLQPNRSQQSQLSIQTPRAPSAADSTPSLVVPLATPPVAGVKKGGATSPPPERRAAAKAPRRTLYSKATTSAPKPPPKRTTTSWSLLRRDKEQAQFTDLELRTLRVQLEKHVQLLTQSIVGTTGVKDLVSIRNRGIDCLARLDELMYNSPQNSIFRIRNLDDAIVSCHEAESYDESKYSPPMSIEAQSAVTTLGWHWQPAVVLAYSRALIYPELIPIQRPLINQTRYAGFLAPEQELLALALYELHHIPHSTGGTGRVTMSKYQAIVSHFLPCKTTTQIRNYINNVRHGPQKSRQHRMIMKALNGEFDESLLPLDDKPSPYVDGERPIDWLIDTSNIMQRAANGVPLGKLPIPPASITPPPPPISLTTVLNGLPVSLTPGTAFSLIRRDDGSLELVPTEAPVEVVEMDRMSEFSAVPADQVPSVADEVDIVSGFASELSFQEGFDMFSPNSTPNPVGDRLSDPPTVDLVSPSPPFTPPHCSSAPPTGRSERGEMRHPGGKPNPPKSASVTATHRPSIMSRRKVPHKVKRDDPDDLIKYRVDADEIPPQLTSPQVNPNAALRSPDENRRIETANNASSPSKPPRISDPSQSQRKRIILLDGPPAKRPAHGESTRPSSKSVLRPIPPHCVPMKSPPKSVVASSSSAKSGGAFVAMKGSLSNSAASSKTQRNQFIAMKPMSGNNPSPISSDDSDDAPTQPPLSAATLLGYLSDTDSEIEEGELSDPRDPEWMPKEETPRPRQKAKSIEPGSRRSESTKPVSQSPLTQTCIQQEADSLTAQRSDATVPAAQRDEPTKRVNATELPEEGELPNEDDEKSAENLHDDEEAIIEEEDEEVEVDVDTVEEEEVEVDVTDDYDAADDGMGGGDEPIAEDVPVEDETIEEDADEVIPDDGNAEEADEPVDDEDEVIPDDFGNEEIDDAESIPDDSMSPTHSRSRHDSVGDEPFVDVTAGWNEFDGADSVFEHDAAVETSSEAMETRRAEPPPRSRRVENPQRWQPLLHQTVMSFARKRLFMHDGKYRTFKSIAGNAEKSADCKYDEIKRLLHDTPELAHCFGAMLRDEDLRPDQRRHPERLAYQSALEMLINIHVYFSDQPNSNVKRRLLKLVCDFCLDEGRLREEMRSLLAGRHDPLWNYLRRFVRGERCTVPFDERRAEHIPLQLYNAFHASFAASAGHPQRLAAVRDTVQREHLDLTHMRWEPGDFRPSLRLHNGYVHGRDGAEFAALNIETRQRDSRAPDVPPRQPATTFKPTDDNVLWALFEAKRDFTSTVNSFVTAFVGSFSVEQTTTRLNQLIAERYVDPQPLSSHPEARIRRPSSQIGDPQSDDGFVRPRLPSAHRKHH